VLLYCTFPVRRTRTTILDIHARPPERHSQGADQGKTGGEGQASREAPVAARRAVPCGRAGRRPLSALRLLLGNVLAGARRAVHGRTGDGTAAVRTAPRGARGPGAVGAAADRSPE